MNIHVVVVVAVIIIIISNNTPFFRANYSVGAVTF